MFSPLRLVQIGIAVYGHLVWWVLVRAGLWRSPLTPARKFTAMLEHLGTPFVKLGQGLSMHTEFLPDDYVAALATLQDHVASFPSAQAVQEIERSFGRKVGELFAEFNPVPMAAGSIAQVHAARLHDYHTVIVKVRRPGIKRLRHRVSRKRQRLRIDMLRLRFYVQIRPNLRLGPVRNFVAQSCPSFFSMVRIISINPATLPSITPAK